MKKVLFAFAALLGVAAAGPAAADKHGTTDGGLYFSAHSMLTNPRASSDFSGARWSYDLGYGVAGAVGYAFVYPEYAGDIRVEFEGAFRSIPFDTVTVGATTFDLGGDDTFLTGMVNVLIDFHTQTRFTPYVGMGAGWGYEQFSDYSVDAFFIGDERWFISVWQAIAGVGFHLSPGLIVDFEYRYFQPNDNAFDGYTSNEASMGLRVVF